ncbi:MAG: N-acetyltransferase [Ruminococcaceae bacterium]|nr:N-acetyltransferase [Oscillospiraceae bacterium]
MIIRNMVPDDRARVLAIYGQGIASGKATFRTICPAWEDWNSGHHPSCRFVAVYNEKVVGFTALSPVSDKAHYAGVAEVMVYVDEKYRRQGVGTALLRALIAAAPENGFWSLYSSIFSANTESIKLHEKCGFRTVGFRERIARDSSGSWVDTTLMEYRFPDEAVKEIHA